MALKDLRGQIDDIDNQIMDLLDKRFTITNEIGKYKKINNISILNKNRENQIINKAAEYRNSQQIAKVYTNLMDISRDYQEYNYFLLGSKLSYSLSPLIHSMYGIQNYQLFETSNPLEVLNSKNFKGCNVTIPYKKIAYEACDYLDESANITKVVNTIINKDNKLLGYNTDYQAIKKMIKRYNVIVEGQKVLIIGNGATSLSAYHAFKSFNAKEISFLVRTIKSENGFEELSIYSKQYNLLEFERFKDYDIIINTTSYGTYPLIEDKPLFSLKNFQNLKVVFDVVYNPSMTSLLEEAKINNIKAINGLYMLVCQAGLSQALFRNKNLESLIDTVYKQIKLLTTNIVLIGMPYSGKTYTGKLLSDALNMPFFDTDELLAKDHHSLEEVLNNKGTVEDFRMYETKIVSVLANKRGNIISTGGGVITIQKNVEALKRNCIIIYLEEELNVLLSRIDDKRPLVKSKEDLIKLYNERVKLYKSYSDLIISKKENVSSMISMIKEKLYEDICN